MLVDCSICIFSLFNFIYSKLTDKEETLESTPAIEDDDGLSVEELERLAAGNNQYESVFGRHQNQQISVIEGDDNKDGKLSSIPQ